MASATCPLDGTPWQPLTGEDTGAARMNWLPVSSTLVPSAGSQISPSRSQKRDLSTSEQKRKSLLAEIAARGTARELWVGARRRLEESLLCENI